MRSVRALDALFAAYSAANLLSRVVVAQAARAARAAEATSGSRLCREVPVTDRKESEFEGRPYNNDDIKSGIQRETIIVNRHEHEHEHEPGPEIPNVTAQAVPNVIEIQPSSSPVIPNETERITLMTAAREERILPSRSNATVNLEVLQGAASDNLKVADVKRRYAKPNVIKNLTSELETMPEPQMVGS
jgi:hypothetical protein